MKFETKYKLLILKRYFDVGYGWTSQLKYLLIAAGLASRNPRLITFVGSIYFVCCFLLGYLLYKFGWIEAQTEIGNRYNPLAKELRKNMKKRKV